MKMQRIASLALALLLTACAEKPEKEALRPAPSDPEATELSRKLFRQLDALSGTHVMLGHQDALAYGMGWKGDEFRTDIFDTYGDHPAVFGWDLGHIGDENNIDDVPFERMKEWAIAAWEKGGLNTYSWHMRNYAVGGTSWDKDSCVEACLPGGSHHDLYVEKLDQAAAFFSDLKTPEGELIPVVLRPFHEMTGGWFWWGKGNCSPEQYKALFRFTIDYLREQKDMHQLLVAYSTDVFESAEQYMTCYPGDHYVDVMGFDDYHGLARKETSHRTIKMLEIIDSLSTAHHKLMALTETGTETIPDSTWFTQVVLPVFKHSPATQRAAWILLWRNGRPDHFYAPHPDHPVAPDFKSFMDDPLMLSLSEAGEKLKAE